MGSWDLQPGDSIIRTELHEKYGGRRQGGISPSAQSANVMIFTDPAVGRRHGYNDGWGSDGRFHYTGEGQLGDQQLIQGNRSVLAHKDEHRAIRLFKGVGGPVTYVGAFDVDSAEPYYRTDAIESGGTDVRQVLVFRLVPQGPVVQDPSDALPPVGEAGAVVVPVESMNSETFVINPSALPREAERREHRLVEAYCAYMTGKGSTIKRIRCLPKGEAKPLFSDLLDQTRNNLLEAKGSGSRDAIRMAIGQLADYGRFAKECSRAVLLPERPRLDLEDLLSSQGIAAVWRTSNGFEDNCGGKFS